MKTFRRMMAFAIVSIFMMGFLAGCSKASETTESIPEATTNKTITYTNEKDYAKWVKTATDTGTYYMPVLNDSVKLKNIEIVGMVTYNLEVTTADGNKYDCSLTWTMDDDGYAYLSNTKEQLGLTNWYGIDEVYGNGDATDPNTIYWVYDNNVFQLVAPAAMGKDEISKLFDLQTKTA